MWVSRPIQCISRDERPLLPFIILQGDEVLLTYQVLVPSSPALPLQVPRTNLDLGSYSSFSLQEAGTANGSAGLQSGGGALVAQLRQLRARDLAMPLQEIGGRSCRTRGLALLSCQVLLVGVGGCDSCAIVVSAGEHESCPGAASHHFGGLRGKRLMVILGKYQGIITGLAWHPG